MNDNRAEYKEYDMSVALAKQIINDYIERMDTIREYNDCDDCHDCEYRNDCWGDLDLDEWAVIASTPDDAERQVKIYVDYVHKTIKTIVDKDLYLRTVEYDSLQELVSDLLTKDYDDLVRISSAEILGMRELDKRMRWTVAHKGLDAAMECMFRAYPKVRKHKRKRI